MTSKIRCITGLIGGLVFLVLLSGSLNAQRLDPVSFTISETPESINAKERFSVTIRADIEGGWYLYSALNDPDAGPYPTSFTPVSNSLFKAGNISESGAEIKYDPNFDKKLGLHSRQAYFTLPVVLDTDSTAIDSVAIDILYQVCDDISCLPPKTKQVSAPISVAGVSDDPYTEYNRTVKELLGRIIQDYGMVVWIIIIILILSLSLRSYSVKKGSDI